MNERLVFTSHRAQPKGDASPCIIQMIQYFRNI
jgi:hypothetical protein